jgi:hypothetical protein
MRAGLQDFVTGGADCGAGRQAVTVSTIRAHAPGTTDDRQPVRLELNATTTAGDLDQQGRAVRSHETHPEHRKRRPEPTSTAHAGPTQAYGNVRAAIDAAVSTNS